MSAIKGHLTCALAAAAAVAVAACGSSSVTHKTPAATSRAQTVAARASQYGRILIDGANRTLYVFTRDRGTSACYGACPTAWPPYLARAATVVGSGVRSSLLGTTRRSDGRLQVTYGGRPVYFYVGDVKPGQILCQGVVEYGGTWQVVSPAGRAIA